MEIVDIIKLVILAGCVVFGFSQYSRGYSQGIEDRNFRMALRDELIRESERRLIRETFIPIKFIKESMESASGPERTYLGKLLEQWETAKKV